MQIDMYMCHFAFLSRGLLIPMREQMRPITV